jgi:thiosulfate dehydrogenase
VGENVKTKKQLARAIGLAILAITGGLLIILNSKKKPERAPAKVSAIYAKWEWKPPDSTRIPHNAEGDLIRYGKNLIANTSFYLGPKGRVSFISNGMNCQNCHLDAGSRLYGNNYSAVFSTYPKFRDRSGTVENIYKRINDCFERSLHGRDLDTGSREMKAIAAYINWVGREVAKNIKPPGAGISDLGFPGRAADTARGRVVYTLQCQRCHGSAGEGLPNMDSSGYIYPPLWGKNSYTSAAGLYRISRFAGYVRDNMPYNLSTHRAPLLSEEECWDVGAFVNSQPRPEKKYPKDWPDISSKPVDYPFGPFADSFTEKQHKLGPFGPIRQARQKRGRNT